ncbi:MAG: hypothetical protein UY23_C0005G0052 [Candidatus Jorgensenbacteria bacterium GW2011_GWA1_48_11]|uniref:Uncharacterized protein n=1 Tax=Candidatus Jorgensenbacteria bacterium GW2011_GWA1_48_11 TaxID=1618660 RepID=A0A0G1U9V6_9BACT|nr:MAG: hypothetical protein UY23_C0005G0052 [Candidatus Jorgensenbacteria bacterium GW2011_GWA1_48_11]KKW12313.1 MAG: hypothetical protein UY51_C0005G0555 [Candidatus Jorgensenbacteria bacterium GW2011_GWB1_49_9]
MNRESRKCQNCHQEFWIEPEDFDFYKKIDVPPPTWCPECRLIRRLLWRDDQTLYKRHCDLCKKEIIAMYPADVSFPVYCRACWYSDGWDALAYGRDYDFSRPFFSQFSDLMQVTPQIALQIDRSTNSDYCNQITDCKNCYLLTSGSDCEDCQYGYRILNSKSVVDAFAAIRCQFCYQTLQSMDSARMLFADRCHDSLDVVFGFDLKGCQNCFMSTNLRHKSYVFKNQQLSKEEYKARMAQIDTGSYAKLREYEFEFNEIKRKSLYKFIIDNHIVDSTGDSLGNTKNCKDCFFTSDTEDSRFCMLLFNAKDIYDVNNGCCVMERCYECSTTGVHAYDVKLSADVWPEARSVSYSQSCRNGVSDLFGCVSLRKKQYCILNKQYSRQEYEELVLRIIKHMTEMPYVDKRGLAYQYGEFFPPEISLFAHNTSTAKDFYPLTREEAEKKGYRWGKEESHDYKPTVNAAELPDHIKDAKDEITKEIIACLHDGKRNEYCTKAFRIIPDELNLYRRMNVPLPRLCPSCRHYQRFRSRNPLKLWERQCLCDYKVHKNIVSHPHHPTGRCPNKFKTAYSSERSEIVYCEQCYNAEVV